jgi:hypothetical protein
MGALMKENVVTDLHEVSKFMNAWSFVFDGTTGIKQGEVSKEFFLKFPPPQSPFAKGGRRGITNKILDIAVAQIENIF